MKIKRGPLKPLLSSPPRASSRLWLLIDAMRLGRPLLLAFVFFLLGSILFSPVSNGLEQMFLSSSGGMTPLPPLEWPPDQSPIPRHIWQMVGNAPPVTMKKELSESVFWDAKFKIYDLLQYGDSKPYFANLRGFQGLFNTQSAFLPEVPVWNFGLNYRNNRLKNLNGEASPIQGSRSFVPLHFLYTGKKLMIGATLPYQYWSLSKPGSGKPDISMSGIHNPEIRFGKEIWTNSLGDTALTLYLAAKFSGNNYDIPDPEFARRTKIGALIGPALATRGPWAEIGGAYSSQLNDRFTVHFNLGLANDSRDELMRTMYSSSMDYRLTRNVLMTGELSGEHWKWGMGPDGNNLDFLLGTTFFNEYWQANFGFPVAIQNDWGHGTSVGFVCGINTRWE